MSIQHKQERNLTQTKNERKKKCEGRGFEGEEGKQRDF